MQKSISDSINERKASGELVAIKDITILHRYGSCKASVPTHSAPGDESVVAEDYGCVR